MTESAGEVMERTAFQHKDNTGSVFNNDRKEKPEQPDRQGDCIIDGKKYSIVGWVNATKNGDPYLKMEFEPWEEYQRKREEFIKAREQREGSNQSSMSTGDVPF